MVKIRKRLRNSWESFRREQQGSTAILMAVLTPMIVAGLAFGSEAGYWQLNKRQLQNATDTAAYAAGTQLRSGLDADAQKNAALTVANNSGFTLALAGTTAPPEATGTLELTSPPSAGAYAGNNSAVHVRLTNTMERRFSKLFLSAPITVSTEATVLVENGRPACVLALHPSASGAVSAGGSANVTLTGCDVATNSIANDSVSTNGNSVAITTDCVSTVGGVDDSHNAFTYTDCPGAIENAPVTADPYANVPEPTWASCANANSFKQAGNPSRPAPGCYNNVNNLSRNVELSPGVYILNNSDLRLNGNDLMSGTDVTIFLTGASSITINGNATIDIKAPTSGIYSGLAIFGDRDDEIDLDLSGNSGVSVVGAIYSPNRNSDIIYTGNTASFNAGECTQVIGGTVEFSGSAEFDTDCSNSGTKETRTAQSISVVE